jgi:hypothetical protein
MAGDDPITKLVEAAFAVANKSQGEPSRKDLEALAEIGGPDASVFNSAFQTIRSSQLAPTDSTNENWQNAADAIASAAQIAGHAIVGGPGIGIAPRGD